jgi:putative spermidine/putrescine transport system substrate-binding protein
MDQTKLNRRDVLKLAALAGAGTALASCAGKGGGAKEETELIVGSWGGVWDESTQKYIIDPLVKETGAKVTIVPGNSIDHFGKLQADPANPPYDVLWLDIEFIAPLAAANGFLPLSEDEIPALKDVYPNLKFFNNQAVCGNFGVLSLIYSTEALPKVDSWETLWDDSVACKFTLSPVESWALQWMITADILAGGDGTNLNNGIEKTKTLAPRAFALIGDYDLRTLFERKEVVVGMLYSGEAYVMYSSGQKDVMLAKPKEGNVMIPNCLVIPKNAKHPNLAKKFIQYALLPEGQQGFIADYASSPATKNVEVSDELKPWMFLGDDVAKVILPDYNKILKDKDAAIERWSAEVVPLVGTSC